MVLLSATPCRHTAQCYKRGPFNTESQNGLSMWHANPKPGVKTTTEIKSHCETGSAVAITIAASEAQAQQRDKHPNPHRYPQYTSYITYVKSFFFRNGEPLLDWQCGGSNGSSVRSKSSTARHAPQPTPKPQVHVLRHLREIVFFWFLIESHC